MKKLTNSKIMVPHEFWTFLHRLQNMRFLCEYLGEVDYYSSIA